MFVYSNDYGLPHIHIISLQEGFDIRLNFDGEFISVKEKGVRKTNKEASFVDIISKAKMWLKLKPTDPKVSEKFATNKEYAEFEWDV